MFADGDEGTDEDSPPEGGFYEGEDDEDGGGDGPDPGYSADVTDGMFSGKFEAHKDSPLYNVINDSRFVTNVTIF